MEGFWRNICECKLLPLTSEFLPVDSELKKKNKYHYELSQANVVTKKNGLIRNAEEYLTEFICLRLTQNFQVVNPEGTCHVDFKRLWSQEVRMGICSKYNILRQQPYEAQNFLIDVYTRIEADSNAIKQADFKYLLFNHHTQRFQVKISQESRLFNFKSLANLGEVLNDLKNALSICIKMPQQHFVLFHAEQKPALVQDKTTSGTSVQQMLFNRQSSPLTGRAGESYLDGSISFQRLEST